MVQNAVVIIFFLKFNVFLLLLKNVSDRFKVPLFGFDIENPLATVTYCQNPNICKPALCPIFMQVQAELYMASHLTKMLRYNAFYLSIVLKQCTLNQNIEFILLIPGIS